MTSKLKASGIRVEVCSGERLPKLIRNAEKQKIPLMAVVGPKEVEMQTVTVRSRFSGELGTITIDDFIGICKKAVENRTSIWNSCTILLSSGNATGICDVIYMLIKQLEDSYTPLIREICSWFLKAFSLSLGPLWHWNYSFKRNLDNLYTSHFISSNGWNMLSWENFLRLNDKNAYNLI